MYVNPPNSLQLDQGRASSLQGGEPTKATGRPPKLPQLCQEISQNIVEKWLRSVLFETFTWNRSSEIVSGRDFLTLRIDLNLLFDIFLYHDLFCN